MTNAEQVAQDLDEDVEALAAYDKRQKDAGVFFAAMSNDNMRTAERAAKRLGYILGQGSYTGCSNDVIGRWYVDRAEESLADRRGPGYVTKRDALRAVAADLEQYV